MPKKFKAGFQSFWGLVYFQFILFQMWSASWSQLEPLVFSGPFLLFRFYTIIFFLPFMTGKLLKALFSFSVLLLFSESNYLQGKVSPNTRLTFLGFSFLSDLGSANSHCFGSFSMPSNWCFKSNDLSRFSNCSQQEVCL